MGVTDLGAKFMLEKVFENTDTYYIGLYLDGQITDNPVIEEVGSADYTREPVMGSTCGSFEWQNFQGANVATQSDTPNAGIAAYKFITATDTLPISWEFLGPLSSVIKSIKGCMLLKGTTPAQVANGAIDESYIISVVQFATPYTPASAGDTLVLESISIRLSEGTVR